MIPAAPNKLSRFRACAKNLCLWRIQIRLCFTQLHFIQTFIGLPLNVFFQLRSNPLCLLVSRKPLMVRLLDRFDEAIVGELVSDCARAILATYNMSFLQFF